MSGSAAELIVILAVFFLGVVLGAIVMVSKAIKREDRALTLGRKAPDAAAEGTRWLTDVGSRDLELSEFTGDREVRGRGR